MAVSRQLIAVLNVHLALPCASCILESLSLLCFYLHKRSEGVLTCFTCFLFFISHLQ